MKDLTPKALIKSALRALARNDLTWKLSRATVVRLGVFLQRQRTLAETGQADADADALAVAVVCDHLFPDRTVRHGPFRGMSYPEFAAVGSKLGPMLLGSYERELWPLIEQICATPYETVLNIGCAEGYYAVGLARRLEGSTVWAYDAVEPALCRQLAAENGVGDRVHLGGSANPTELANRMQGKTLVVCDCEGCEREIFTARSVRAFAKCDLLIETHDLLDITISRGLHDLFEPTHHVEVIASIDDIKKAHAYDFPELSDLTLAQRKLVVAEHRAAIVEWLWLEPR